MALCSTGETLSAAKREAKDFPHEDLNSLIANVPKNDKLIILGDFNARVSTDNVAWEGVIGRNGIGKCNSNGLLVLKIFTEHELLITNTIFCLPNRSKTSWMHPHSKHWHLIDYVLTRKKDRQGVHVTKAMCGDDYWTDHRLIISKLCRIFRDAVYNTAFESLGPTSHKHQDWFDETNEEIQKPLEENTSCTELTSVTLQHPKLCQNQQNCPV